jgi:hypothetical protein
MELNIIVDNISNKGLQVDLGKSILVEWKDGVSQPTSLFSLLSDIGYSSQLFNN